MKKYTILSMLAISALFSCTPELLMDQERQKLDERIGGTTKIEVKYSVEGSETKAVAADSRPQTIDINVDINDENLVWNLESDRAKAEARLKVAVNTLKTVTISSQVIGLVRSSMKDLESVFSFQLPDARLLGDVYGVPGIVADTHCIRICNLLGLAKGKDPVKVEEQLRKVIPPEESSDFCHRMVLHGRALCMARNPNCEACPLRELCNFENT